jgi:hypothetical protein
MEWEAAQVLLIANGVWDLCCAVSILFGVSPLQNVHMSVWKEEEDQDNTAARHLMAYLILVWGGMRLMAAGGWGLEWAWVSYLIETNVFACETLLFERMHAGQGMAVSVASFLLVFCFYLAFQMLD